MEDDSLIKRFLKDYSHLWFAAAMVFVILALCIRESKVDTRPVTEFQAPHKIENPKPLQNVPFALQGVSSTRPPCLKAKPMAARRAGGPDAVPDLWNIKYVPLELESSDTQTTECPIPIRAGDSVPVPDMWSIKHIHMESESSGIQTTECPIALVDFEQSRPLFKNIIPHYVKRSVHKFHPIILEAADQHQIEAALIKAIIMAESGYNPWAISKKGAVGLMQLMPETAESLGVENVFDPEHNINGGVKYYKQLLERFKGDVRLALAAYNAGAENVLKYQGIPPFKTTQYYIKKVFKYYQYYKMDMEERIDKA